MNRCKEKKKYIRKKESKMGKTKIDWCDYTINPVIGCTFGCKYCYAKKLNDRFRFIEDFSKPQFRENQLNKIDKIKNSTIFMNSMSDIADWEIETVNLNSVLEILDKYNNQEKELQKYKDLWSDFKQMLEKVKRLSEEREDRAFIHYDELIDGNKKLEQKHNIGGE